MNFDFEKIKKETEIWKKNKEELFTSDNLEKLESFAYFGNNLEELGSASNSEFLFKKYNKSKKIFPIFEYLKAETSAENQRYNNTTFAVYNFNQNDSFNSPTRIDISCKKNPIPNHLKEITKSKAKPITIIDIEFFEKNPLIDDSKNKELEDFIKDYTINGEWTIEHLKELGDLMALGDLEKIHMEFLVFDDFSFIPLYIGIGNNQPYNISEKQTTYGKNRFFRYDLKAVTPYIQNSNVIKGDVIDFSGQNFISPEATSDGTLFALHFNQGIALLDGKTWKKAKLEQSFNHLNLDEEINKENNLDYLKEAIKNIFPEFENYSQIFYDPMERVNSYGHLKTIKYLNKKGLLGSGWTMKINVASDLYLNGYVPTSKLKPSVLLLYHMIDTGKLYELIINTVKDKQTDAFMN